MSNIVNKLKNGNEQTAKDDKINSTKSTQLKSEENTRLAWRFKSLNDERIIQ